MPFLTQFFLRVKSGFIFDAFSDSIRDERSTFFALVPSEKGAIEMLDTLMYVKKLEAVGVPREQAEAQVEIMSQIVDSNFATKQDLKDLAIANKHDLKDLSAELRAEMGGLSTELRTEMNALSTELRTEMSELRLEIKSSTNTYGKMLVAAVGIIIAAMGMMLKL
jgi:hypothetical protein